MDQSNDIMDRIREIIVRYNEQREPNETIASSINLALQEAEKHNSAIHYALAGSLNMTSGNFESAFKCLIKAIETDGSLSVSHAILGIVYLKLAIFDMFDRGLCEVHLLERSSISENAISRYLGYLVKELVAPGRPKIYQKHLEAKGYNTENILATQALVMLKTLNKKGTFYPKWKADINDILIDFEKVNTMPVPVFKVDESAECLLKLAQKELSQYSGAVVALPSGWTVIRPERIKASMRTVEFLLGKEGQLNIPSNSKEHQLDIPTKSFETTVIHVFGSKMIEIAAGIANGIHSGMIFNIIRGDQDICKIRITNVVEDKATGTTIQDTAQLPRVGDIAIESL